jgi:hypothetical protein
MNMKRFLPLLSLFIFLVTHTQAQWNTVSLGTTNTINGIRYYGTSDIWIVSAAGLHKSTNNGGAFTTYPLQMTSGQVWILSQLNDVAVLSANTASTLGLCPLDAQHISGGVQGNRIPNGHNRICCRMARADI